MMSTDPQDLETPVWNGSNGGGNGWSLDKATGTWVMPLLQDKFLDWLLSDPKDPETKAQWCAENGVHVDTPKRWKRDRRFQTVWEERAKAKNVSVDRVQSVVDSLHKAATGGDVKAASLYLQYIDKFIPQKRIVTETSETKDMSDEALRQEMAQLVEEMS